jgi:hypothetical protein
MYSDEASPEKKRMVNVNGISGSIFQAEKYESYEPAQQIGCPEPRNRSVMI